MNKTISFEEITKIYQKKWKFFLLVSLMLLLLSCFLFIREKQKTPLMVTEVNMQFMLKHNKVKMNDVFQYRTLLLSSSFIEEVNEIAATDKKASSILARGKKGELQLNVSVLPNATLNVNVASSDKNEAIRFSKALKDTFRDEVRKVNYRLYITENNKTLYEANQVLRKPLGFIIILFSLFALTFSVSLILILLKMLK
ncbi:hypothetical protein [Carnobacterium maltaromaticum]|uniref:hypothetical protein n=1 Tax=Carnobacterium maltaromaticum TaxID=2751 RepID=UPI0039BDFF8D